MYLVETAALYMPGALKLDILNYYGSPSMTLKNVAKQNGVVLSDEDAHDALNDIKATVGVAKVIKKVAPQVWEQMLKLSTVEGVNKFLDDNDVFTSARFIHGRATKASVMTSLAEREGSTTQALFDLRVDPAPYLKMTVEELKDVFLTKSGKENPFVLVRKDSQPVLMPLEISDAIVKPEDDIPLYKSRAKALKANKDFRENVAKAALLAKKEQLAAEPAQPALSELMMNKKLSAAVEKKINLWTNEFREADDWKARADLVKGFRERFKDELEKDPSLDRYAKIAGTVVYDNAPEQLTDALQTAMKKFIATRLFNPDLKAPYMTLARARKDLAQIEWLRAKPDSDKWKEVTDTDIRKLKLYYTAIEKEYAPYAPAAHQHPPANNNTPEQPVVKKPSTGFNKQAPKP
jgi:exodeoxyribonuclease-1